MANWQITQTQQVGNTTINTWQNVPSLEDIMAEARREEAQRLTKRAADFLPCGHPKEAALQMEFGSWSCQMCKAANSR